MESIKTLNPKPAELFEQDNLLIDQPDLGQSILIIGSWIATVFISGVSLMYILSFFLIFAIILGSLTIVITFAAQNVPKLTTPPVFLGFVTIKLPFFSISIIGNPILSNLSTNSQSVKFPPVH